MWSTLPLASGLSWDIPISSILAFCHCSNFTSFPPSPVLKTSLLGTDQNLSTDDEAWQALLRAVTSLAGGVADPRQSCDVTCRRRGRAVTSLAGGVAGPHQSCDEAWQALVRAVTSLAGGLAGPRQRWFAFSNVEAAAEFEEQRARFFAEHERYDDYMEMREGLDLSNVCNFKEYVIAYSDPDHLPWYSRQTVFWTCSLLLLSWPLRMIIECNTAYVHYQCVAAPRWGGGGGGGGRSLRRPADQRHRLAQFPHAGVRWPGRGLSLGRLVGRLMWVFWYGFQPAIQLNAQVFSGVRELKRPPYSPYFKTNLVATQDKSISFWTCVQVTKLFGVNYDVSASTPDATTAPTTNVDSSRGELSHDSTIDSGDLEACIRDNYAIVPSYSESLLMEATHEPINTDSNANVPAARLPIAHSSYSIRGTASGAAAAPAGRRSWGGVFSSGSRSSLSRASMAGTGDGSRRVSVHGNRLVYLASPLAEHCPQDPLQGRSVTTPTENPPAYEDALRLPALSRLRRSLTDRGEICQREHRWSSPACGCGDRVADAGLTEGDRVRLQPRACSGDRVTDSVAGAAEGERARLQPRACSGDRVTDAGIMVVESDRVRLQARACNGDCTVDVCTVVVETDRVRLQPRACNGDRVMDAGTGATDSDRVRLQARSCNGDHALDTGTVVAESDRVRLQPRPSRLGRPLITMETSL
ncbi:hypothetical protein PR048_025870 [Dryococelus australis]|uniref:Uncharacterized protein n=1 Tax=Dryococelus australis TaxID=614101 RepID=A0ABQ9GJR1_9NEOP|nr:hypothetical protein PR048_025870 [Dryococelus australis]